VDVAGANIYADTNAHGDTHANCDRDTHADAHARSVRDDAAASDGDQVAIPAYGVTDGLME
jgi:hypothetical protein